MSPEPSWQKCKKVIMFSIFGWLRFKSLQCDTFWMNQRSAKWISILTVLEDTPVNNRQHRSTRVNVAQREINKMFVRFCCCTLYDSQNVHIQCIQWTNTQERDRERESTEQSSPTDIARAPKCAFINQLIADETGQSLERVAEDTDRDYWMSVEEAIDYGIVGKVVKSSKEI